MAVLVSTTPISAASIVRGQLFRLGPEGQRFPASSIAVRLVNQNRGPSGFAYTGSDGMYYLYNIPADNYTLEVWLSQDPNRRLKVNVRVDDRPYTDVAPMEVP